MAERMAEILHGNGTHLKRAMVALAAAVLLIGIGLGIH
jgi:hypothetical protein